MMEELIYVQNRNLLSQKDLNFFKSSAVSSSVIYEYLLVLLILMAILLAYHLSKKTNKPLIATTYFVLSICIGLAIGIPYLQNRNPVIGWILILSTPFFVYVFLYYRSLALSLSKQLKPPEDLSREREKIFQLLETGKINVQEAKELLNAIYEPVEKSVTNENKVINKLQVMNKEKLA